MVAFVLSSRIQLVGATEYAIVVTAVAEPPASGALSRSTVVASLPDAETARDAMLAQLDGDLRRAGHEIL